MSAFATGPHVNAAFVCERVLTEQDGTNTYVRVIDRFVRQIVSVEQPPAPPPMPINAWLVLVLKPGDAKGSFELALVIEKPSGERVPVSEFTVNFGGSPNAGANAHLQLQIELNETGLWWIDVLGGSQKALMTRVPMELQDQWVKGQTTLGPGQPS